MADAPTQALVLKKMSTQDIAALANVPSVYAEMIPQEDWAAMSVEDRVVTIDYLRGQERETTDGLPVELPKIKFPSSSSSFFEVPGPTGMEPFRVLNGVVVWKTSPRALWLPVDKEPAQGTPPDCWSFDSIRPDADVGTAAKSKYCSDCVFNQWKSGKDNKGKGCRERVKTGLLMDGSDIPFDFSIPPTSIKAFTAYAVGLASAKVPGGLAGVVTEFSLIEAKSRDNTAYKQLVCKIARKLTFPELQRAMECVKVFAKAAEKRGLDDLNQDARGEGAAAAPGTEGTGATVIDVTPDRDDSTAGRQDPGIETRGGY